MRIIDRLKTDVTSGNAEHFKKTLKARCWILLFLPVLVIPASALKILIEDGREILSLQQDALILEIYSRTDLPTEAYAVLEERLRALDGIKEVTAVSPEESLQKVAEDPGLKLDTAWLLQKKEDLKGRDTLLPWTYNLYLAKWDETALSRVIAQIEGFEASPGIKAVTEIHHDRERWSLALALIHYMDWIKWILAVYLFLSAAGLMYLASRVRSLAWAPEEVQESLGFLALGALGGLLSHLILAGALAAMFLPEGGSWVAKLGRGLSFETGLSLAFGFCAFALLRLERAR